jgi:two-component system sensor histidine kinase VicK
MRWWLAAVFAVIAAVTAVAVGQLLSQRSEDAFRQRAQQLAAGNAFEAAIAIRRETGPIDLRRRVGLRDFQRAVEEIAVRRRLSLFVFDSQGNLLTGSRSRGLALESIQRRADALRAALAGNRFVSTNEVVGGTIVAFPRRDATILVAYAPHPDLGAGIRIVRHEIVQAALWATLIGALAGAVVAALIATRLRRIAAAAAAIEQGRFEIALEPRFRDEVGDLAATIDRMRRRLQRSFGLLRSERDRLERLLERLQEGVLTVDRGLLVDFANTEARRLLRTPALRRGEPLPDPWPDVSLRSLADRLFREAGGTIESRVSPPDEDSTYTLVGIPAPPDSETAIIVINDVSERERRERAEREFVTNAAHELRTPLTTITGAVEALQSGAKDVPAQRDRFLDHIERESARLARLVRALLILARAQTREEPPQLGPVPIRPLLEEIRDELQPRPGVSVEVDCADGLAVLGQRELALQALANIAANAVRFTNRGRIVLRAGRLNGSIAIEVEDTGPGISARDQKRLFDRFYRSRARDAEGFGLGLAIVREAVRALGGTVEIDSRPGGGTTVRIVLAATDAEAA